MLDTKEKINEDSQMYPNLDFGKTESEAADLCEILDENRVPIRTASGSSLCPTRTITCDFKLGKQPFSFEFIVCRGLSRPCILGLDFLRKYKIGIWLESKWKIPIG